MKPGSYTQIYIHLMIVVKRRKKLLTPDSANGVLIFEWDNIGYEIQKKGDKQRIYRDIR